MAIKSQEKTSLATRILSVWKENASHPAGAPRCFIGFDGFTDDIMTAVDKRTSLKSFKEMKKMEQFGGRIVDFAGKSCNIELVVRQRKLGGNAPIMANALLEGAHRITFSGMIGHSDEIEPLFREMASRCEKVYPLGPSSSSEAIEFQNGKIILGKLENMFDLHVETVLNHIGRTELSNILEDTDLFVCANWTMIQMMTPLWKLLIKDFLPHLSLRPRWMFVDLADPEKRTDEDLRDGLLTLAKLEKGFKVILGLNEAEALRIGKLLKIKHSEISSLADDIRKKLGYCRVVIHGTKYAISSDLDETVMVKGPYTSRPLLTTGGGDNFNAGYCNGLLWGFSSKEALTCGVATSGYYVRNGKSPTVKELAKFLKEWEKPNNETTRKLPRKASERKT